MINTSLPLLPTDRYFSHQNLPVKNQKFKFISSKSMLKFTFPQSLSTLNIKFKPPRIKFTVRNSHTTSTQDVRQNAPMKINPSYLLPPTSAYIHLPFCRKRCHYCDFPIVAIGSFANRSCDEDPRIVDYIELVCREIMATRMDIEHCPPLETLFFGGGTPSLVPPRLVGMVLDTLKSKVKVSSKAEITMEMDPGTFDAEKLRELMELGLNRVSLGVQAFQEGLLKACGRAHGVKEAYEAIEIVKTCGVENWSMDLISSLPHQNSQMWDESLTLTIDAAPAHISVYDLQVEQDTKFGVLYKPGEFPLPSDTQSAEFYKKASKTLTNAGYTHYEISSYSKPGFECNHNLTYWKNKSFYAFGLGSASFVNGVRFSRPRRMKEYLDYVQNLEKQTVTQCQINEINHLDRAMDVVMLSLRTAHGLDMRSWVRTFGGSLGAKLCGAYEPYVETGHIEFLNEKREAIGGEKLRSLDVDEVWFIRLSDPDGFLLSNELISVAFGVIAP